jgi:hypothetical protein
LFYLAGHGEESPFHGIRRGEPLEDGAEWTTGFPGDRKFRKGIGVTGRHLWRKQQ